MSLQQWRFFAGKGGVGKTTLSAAHAIALAQGGARVLCVSTDPAHSLGDALGLRLSARPKRIALPGARGGRGGGALFAAELDADRALSRWLAARRRSFRTIAARGTYLDDADIDGLFDLSLPGVDELIGLVELGRLARTPPPGEASARAEPVRRASAIRAPATRAAYDAVVVDTAPTGHTLRLLEMPETLRQLAGVLEDMQQKHRLLKEALGRAAYRPDFADAAIEEIAAEAASLRARLRDAAQTSFSLVALPEALPVEETRDAAQALGAAGIAVAEVVVNRVEPEAVRGCPGCRARAALQRGAIASLRDALPELPLRFIAAQDEEPRGVRALAALRPLERLPPAPRGRPAANDARRDGRAGASPGEGDALLLRTVAPAGTQLVLFGGKGGVGKTTCAAAAAIALAARGVRVLLLSTDPAHSLSDVLGARLSDDEAPVPAAPPSLRARELDARRSLARERDRYQQGVDEFFDALRGDSRFDASLDRAVVRDLIDLAPPGIDELFALLALIDALVPAQGAPRFEVVVVDTAPTGHTLRLLALQESALSWTHALLAILLKYREAIGLPEVAATLTQTARELRKLGELLRDPVRTRFAAVTRAEELPLLETARLLDGLRALRIPAPALIVNALTQPGCPRCERARRAEARMLRRLRASKAARRCAMLTAPAQSPPPQGPAALAAFARGFSDGMPEEPR